MVYEKEKEALLWQRDKKKGIEAYFHSSASMDELSTIHGVLGSNTVGDWLRKYRNLRPSKALNVEIMSINKACNLLGCAKSTFYKVRKNVMLKALREEMIEAFALRKMEALMCIQAQSR